MAVTPLTNYDELHKLSFFTGHGGAAMLKGLRELLYGLQFVAVFLLTSLVSLALLVVLPGMGRRRRLVRRAAALVFRLGRVDIGVEGLEQLPETRCVVVANHASYLDGILLTAVLPPRFAFVIKREMTRVPLAHFLLRRIGSEFVERFDKHRGAVDARRIFRRAPDGQSLAFFPEGGFGPEPGLRRFQPGAFVLAARQGLPVVPVIIRGSRQVLPAGRILVRPGRIEVIIRPALPTADRQATHTLLEGARRSILDGLPEPDADAAAAAAAPA